MKYIIISIFILSVFVWVIVFDGTIADDTLPKKYRKRSCSGRSWKKAFPKNSKTEIRNFLLLFASAFAFSSKNKLKFEPEDKVLDIYRELYPSKWMPDALEIETLAEDLEKEYSISFNDLWHEDVSLGEIFSKIPNKRIQH